MSIKAAPATVGAGIAAAATIGIAILIPSVGMSERADVPSIGGTPSLTFEDPTDLSEAGVLKAATPDLPCALQAAPDLPKDADPRTVDVVRSNWASQTDPPRQPMTRAEAISAARAMSTSVEEARSTATVPEQSSMPAAAAQASYRAAGAWFGGSVSPIVAPERCVWVVTVHAPFAPMTAPDPSVARTYPTYTAMFDVRSGQFLAVGAGSSASDLITGDLASP